VLVYNGPGACNLEDMTAAPLRWEVPATPDQVAPLRRLARSFAVQHGFGSVRADDVALAVSEALTNVVLHAYRDGGAAGQMCLVAAGNTGGWVDFEITDEGVGVVPNASSPGLGLGISIMRQLSDAFDLGGGASGGRVRLRFGR
jgi:anti-sigma regulatory factor (Ser/Thr protein kinase)